MEYTLKITDILDVTHDVKRIRLGKPEGYHFMPGQATELAVNMPDWKDEKRPFTFTSLNSDPYLEFTIKCYKDHKGVTNKIDTLRIGDEVIIGDPWGAIEYKGEGYFIAGGAGITPFIAILKQLHRDNQIGNNKLFFSNKTPGDIIYEQELHDLLGNNAFFILTESSDDVHTRDFIDEAFIKTHIKEFDAHFYICGPDKMTSSITDILTREGVEPHALIFEK